MSLQEASVRRPAEIADRLEQEQAAWAGRPPIDSSTSLIDDRSPSGAPRALPSHAQNDALVVEMVRAREAARGGPFSRSRFERLRDRVCAAHIGFAVIVCLPYFHRRGRLEHDDIKQLAALGLMRACETFDPTRGLSFRKYLATWVRQFVGRGIANEGRIIRAPVHVQHARARCNRISAKFVASTGRVPTVDELSKLTGFSPLAVGYALAQPCEVASLDTPAFDGEPETLGDRVPSDDLSPLDAVLAKERSEYARAILGALPIRERAVVERHIAERDTSLEEIGATLAAERTGRVGLSRQRVQQIEQEGMDRLRKRANKTLRLDS